ncbi:UNVERIFIED_ORG: hypothetical protein GGE44_000250 [Rhizobium esperanzae]
MCGAYKQKPADCKYLFGKKSAVSARAETIPQIPLPKKNLVILAGADILAATQKIE